MFQENYDVLVIGAGHAGVEAALAAARMGCRTALFTLSLDGIANMPCNPSIGGTAKGHLVREIDALGGEMGRAADACFLQSRMLNSGKGPAVHSLRVQADRVQYHLYMKRVCERQENLFLRQGEIVEILTEGKASGERWVCGVTTRLGSRIGARAVIVCTGTFLRGAIYVGEQRYASGPDGVAAPTALTLSLERLGLPLRRFKTGTPCRVHRRSIDFSKLERQDGDSLIQPFSFETLPCDTTRDNRMQNKVSCWIAYTNARTHQIIRDNLHRSPLFSGVIEGVGPRYCPSIEDKVVRFAEKERHQIFVEPMGLDTDEFYLQGMSSSLPEDVQQAFLRTIPGLENVEIMRNAYAIEYDCIDPTALKATLETRQISGLFGAGQFNGTSGYEEAAAQGMVAGINAALSCVSPGESFFPERSNSYIGTLIDDLVTKGCADPYRMMTSRSEYRLLLRQDNADERLTPFGYRFGLISRERYERFQEKMELIAAEWKRVQKTTLPPSPALNRFLEEAGTAPLQTGCKIADLIRRPQLDYFSLAPFDAARPELPYPVAEQVNVKVKYDKYIEKQQLQVKEMRRMENYPLPENLDYHKIRGLRLEAMEKLSNIQPRSIGQASRISGVSPADISVLLIWLRTKPKAEL